jgi:hypothetical protein
MICRTCASFSENISYCIKVTKVVEVPGFEPGCRARNNTRNNGHLTLGVVWSIDGSIVDVLSVPHRHYENK